MDENVSKAFIIVAGILISVSLVSLLTFSMNKVKGLAENQDDEVETEQIEAFNKEYEAYDKDLMFGIDVLSCLGKAKSTNDKIINKYGEKLSSDYEVTVEITMNSKLSESILVWYIDEKDGEIKEYPRIDNTLPGVNLEEAGFTFFEKNAKNNSFLSKLTSNQELKEYSEQLSDMTNKFILNASSEEDSNANKLLNSITYMSEIILNKNPETQNEWCKAEYRSVTYDFKTKKFKCTGLVYNSKNSRVNKILFEEYK